MIIPGVITLSLLFLLIAIWDIKQKRNITLEKFDLSDVTVYMAGRKRIITNYRGHSTIFSPSTFNVPERTNRTDIFGNSTYVSRTVEGISLTLEANDTVTNIQQPDNLSQKDIIERITELLFRLPLQYELKGKIHIATNGCRVIYQQHGVETDKNYLKFLLDLLINLIEVYPSIVTLGGEVIPPLISAIHAKTPFLSPIAPQLLRDIELETNARIGPNPLHHLCTRCLVRCASHKVDLAPGRQIRYYGCRYCGQSRDVIELQKRIIVVLDNNYTEEEPHRDSVLKANWFARRELFDFDEVQILKATDEEIERFAVKVGNDTDESRTPKYKQMRCIVSSNCDISENTARILKSLFGHVEIKALTEA
jgi:hypothetical protein